MIPRSLCALQSSVNETLDRSLKWFGILAALLGQEPHADEGVHLRYV